MTATGATHKQTDSSLYANEKIRNNTFAEIVNNSVNPLLEAAESVDRLELRNVRSILLDRTDSTLASDWSREVRRIPSYFLKRLTCVL